MSTCVLPYLDMLLRVGGWLLRVGGWVQVQMEEFMSGSKKILVATDVVARGINPKP